MREVSRAAEQGRWVGWLVCGSVQDQSRVGGLVGSSVQDQSRVGGLVGWFVAVCKTRAG